MHSEVWNELLIRSQTSAAALLKIAMGIHAILYNGCNYFSMLGV